MSLSTLGFYKIVIEVKARFKMGIMVMGFTVASDPCFDLVIVGGELYFSLHVQI